MADVAEIERLIKLKKADAGVQISGRLALKFSQCSRFALGNGGAVIDTSISEA